MVRPGLGWCVAKWYKDDPVDPSKSTSATVKRQEKRAGKLVGGRRRSGSGSNPLAKGDFVSRDVLGECKQTGKKSFSVTRVMLAKLEREAIAEGKAPVLHLEFLGPSPAAAKDLTLSWAMVPEWYFSELMQRRDDDESR